MQNEHQNSKQSSDLTEAQNAASTDQTEKLPEQEAEKKPEVAVREAEMFKDQLLRKAAEFENYKRRMESEIKTLIENATERLIFELLPVLDDFDRFLKSSPEQGEHDALRKGVELISSKLNATLSKRGLAPFESSGKPFDVHYHDALLQVPRDDVPPNTVIEEVNKGYMLNDKILRHARVIVSAPTNSDQTPATPVKDEGLEA